MKKTFRLIFPVLIFACLIISFEYFLGREKKPVRDFKPTLTKKDSHKKVKQIPKKIVKKKNKKSKKRNPSSIPSQTKNTILNPIPLLQRRVVSNGHNVDLSAPLNSYNDHWQDEFLRRNSSSKLKVKISHLNSVVLVNSQGARLAELVKVDTNLNGVKGAYKAYIDSETGIIIKSWNKIHYELNPHKKKYFHASN